MQKGLVLALAALAACGPISTGGSGFLKDGTAIVAQAEGGGTWDYTLITLSSSDGWTCDGTYKHTASAGRSTVTLPLNCNDGKHGSGIISFNQFQQQAKIVFTIQGGRSGYATFGSL